MAKVILAVAVGETATQVIFNTANPNVSAVRPYIDGLIFWLGSQNRGDPPQPDNTPPQYQIPGGYSIIYRERPVGNASLDSAFQDATALQADLWFCMSTSVAKAADRVAKAQSPTKPIVAIVSDPFSEGFGDNVCGISASRDRLATRCLREFKKRTSVKNVFVLHREGYPPSDKARQWIGKKNVELVAIADTDSTQAMQNKITTRIVNSTKPNKGVLVLPADRFFGVADQITHWTGNIATFWSTPDFPARAIGGFGYPQKKCGQFMAERVAIIWKNLADNPAQDPMPDPKWVAMDKDDLDGRP